MSLVMQDFISSIGGTGFVRSLPRPPVPGEETDTSATAGASMSAAAGNPHYAASTRSSGGSSHRSHASSTKSSASKSPAATPRKSNLDRTLVYAGSDDPAPLGFEPEGSVAGSPRCFAETSGGTPAACLRWAESLRCLLEDGEGVKLYKAFLDQELENSQALDFWFACSGLRLVAPGDVNLVGSLVKLIYRKYVKREGELRLSGDVRRGVVDRLKRKQLDQTIFDAAQAEVESSMRSETYPLFLKSDLYLTYIQTGGGGSGGGGTTGGGESPKTSNNSSGSDTRPMFGLLPTVHEERELAARDISAVPVEQSPSLTESSLVATRRCRGAVRPERIASSGSGVGRVPNPYHVSYAPVSARDSELQSAASSDALTDDTTSQHTDSSLDGRDQRPCKSSWKRQHKTMQRYAAVNQQSDLCHPLIPRTDRAPRDHNLAENDPERFATMLIDRLQRIKEEAGKLERIKESMDNIELSSRDLGRTSLRAPPAPPAASAAPAVPPALVSDPSPMLRYSAFAPELFSASLLDASSTGADDTADSILEDHVSRVWDDTMANRRLVASDDEGRGYHGDYRNVSAASIRLASSAFLHHPSLVHHHSSAGGLSSHFVVPSALSSSTSTFDSGVVNDDHRGGHFDGGHFVSGGHFYSAADRRRDAYEYSRSNDAGQNRGALQPLLQSTPRLKGAMTQSVGRFDEGAGFHAPAMVRSESWGEDCFESDAGVAMGSSANSQCASDVGARRRTTAGAAHHSGGGGGGGSAVGVGMRQPEGRQYFAASQHEQSRHGLGLTQTLLWNSDDPGQGSAIPPPPPDDARGTQQQQQQQQQHRQRSFHKRALYSDESTTRDAPRDLRPSGAAPAPPRQDAGRSLSAAVLQQQQQHCGLMNMSAVDGYYAQHHRHNFDAPNRPAPPPTQRLANHQVGNARSSEVTVVGYKFCDEDIPYRTTVSGKVVTLGQFKQLITKRGNFRYFFKKACDEFDSGGVVHEEVFCDGDVLPLYEGKIFGKIEKRQ